MPPDKAPKPRIAQLRKAFSNAGWRQKAQPENWRIYCPPTSILPIEEPARQLAFLDILLSVADRLYGREVFSEICMGIFVRDK